MNLIAIRYISLVAVTLFVFVNFIACGSQLYQVSLEGDTAEAEEDGADPGSAAYGVHAQFGWQSLPIPFKYSVQIDSELQAQLSYAMKVWETAVGKPLFSLTGIEERRGDDFGSLGESVVDLVNGHYLNFTWSKTGKGKQVLATTVWENQGRSAGTIKTSDIRYNVQNYLLGNSLVLRATETQEVADLISLAIHEIGHLLGLSHVDGSVDRDSIMNPYLYIGEGLISRTISLGDVERIQSIYPCEGDACDLDYVVNTIDAMDYKGSLSK